MRPIVGRGRARLPYLNAGGAGPAMVGGHVVTISRTNRNAVFKTQARLTAIKEFGPV